MHIGVQGYVSASLQVLEEARRGRPGARVRDGVKDSELLCWCWDPNPVLVQEQCTLLTPRLSLQTLKLFVEDFIYFHFMWMGVLSKLHICVPPKCPGGGRGHLISWCWSQVTKWMRCQTRILWKGSQCFYPLSRRPSNLILLIKNIYCIYCVCEQSKHVPWYVRVSRPEVGGQLWEAGSLLPCWGRV